MARKLTWKTRLLFCAIGCLLALGANAQNISISGTATDGNDKPVEGASVVVKGASTGVITGASGEYSIQAPGNGTLVFSFIGMREVEESIGGRTLINVTMVEEAEYIDEIVVMGYTSKARAEISSSVVTLSSDKLTDVTSSNVASMLQGKAAGVVVSSSTGAPGAIPEILIRGAGSINAQSTPLYVVDGIIGGSYNPNDVETLTVLKDAAATALYGSAAAGGVIIITTKQAKYNQKTVVDFKATFGIKSVDNGNFKLMSGESLYNFQKIAMPPAMFETSRPVKLKKQNFDWLDAAFDPGYVQNYYLSVMGGSDKTKYRVSADYYDEDGTLISSDYQRLNLRANLTAKLYDNVTLTTNVSYNHSKNKNYAWYTLEDAYKNMPWDNPYDKNGNLLFINSNTRPDGGTWYGNRKMNFLQSNEYNYNNYAGDDITGDVVLAWDITNWLTFESRNRASTSNSFNQAFVDPRTFDPEYKDRGTNTEINTVGYSLATTELLMAKHSFGKHTIDAFVGVELSRWNDRTTTAMGIDVPSVGLPSVGVTIPFDVDGSLVEATGMSYLGQVQYAYDHKYIAAFSMRADGSSTFSPDHRWGTFPAGSLAWVASKESFLENNAVISFLKLRGSFGVTGNSNIDQYKYMTRYALSGIYGGKTGAISINLPNPQLGWETAWMSNVGVDINLFKRINLSVDLYNIENKDLLLNVPESPSSGYEYILKNAGSVRNQGIEIQLSTENIKGQFTWTTDFNIAFNKNKVYDIPGGEAFTTSAGGSSVLNQIIAEGENVFTWYMPKWVGVDPQTGNPMWERTKDDNGNPIPTEITNDYAKATPQMVGNAAPAFTGGLVNTFTYKGIGLSINCNFLYDNLIYNQGRESFDIDGRSLDINQMELASGWSRWAKPGDNATHPKPVMGGNMNADKTSSRYLEDGSYFRIRNITLSYTLPTQWLKASRISKLRVYASADNLFTFTNYSGMDPEVSYQRSEWSLPGLQSFKYPLSKQILGGIEITF